MFTNWLIGQFSQLAAKSQPSEVIELMKPPYVKVFSKAHVIRLWNVCLHLPNQLIDQLGQLTVIFQLTELVGASLTPHIIDNTKVEYLFTKISLCFFR